MNNKQLLGQWRDIVPVESLCLGNMPMRPEGPDFTTPPQADEE